MKDVFWSLFGMVSVAEVAGGGFLPSLSPIDTSGKRQD